MDNAVRRMICCIELNKFGPWWFNIELKTNNEQANRISIYIDDDVVCFFDCLTEGKKWSCLDRMKSYVTIVGSPLVLFGIIFDRNLNNKKATMLWNSLSGLLLQETPSCVVCVKVSFAFASCKIQSQSTTTWNHFFSERVVEPQLVRRSLLWLKCPPLAMRLMLRTPKTLIVWLVVRWKLNPQRVTLLKKKLQKKVPLWPKASSALLVCKCHISHGKEWVLLMFSTSYSLTLTCASLNHFYTGEWCKK